MRRSLLLWLFLAAAPAEAEPPKPPADLRPMQRYGLDHPDCLGWTDGCVICTQKACSTPGIACTPGATVCTAQAAPDAQKPELPDAPKPEAPKPAEPPPVAPPVQKP